MGVKSKFSITKELQNAMERIFNACTEVGMVEDPGLTGIENVVVFIKEHCVPTQVYPTQEPKVPNCPGSDKCGHYAYCANCDGCSRTHQRDLFEPL